MLNDVLKSKRFWVAVASVIAVVLKDKLPVSEADLTNIVLVAASWIVGDSLRGVSTDVEVK